MSPVTITLSTRNLSVTRYSHPFQPETPVIFTLFTPSPQWHPLHTRNLSAVAPVTFTLFNPRHPLHSPSSTRDIRYIHPVTLTLFNPRLPLHSPSSTRDSRYIHPLQPETPVTFTLFNPRLPLHSPSTTRDSRYTDSPSSIRNLSDICQVAITLFKPKPDTRYIQPLQCGHPVSVTAVIAPLLLDRPGTPAHPS